MFPLPALLWPFIKILIIIVIGLVVVITYVPYNSDLTGEWSYENDRIWLSRTWCGSYNIYELDNNMNHIGSLSADRMLNLDKYDIVDPSGCLENLNVSRLTISKKNSEQSLCDNDDKKVFVKKS